MSKVKLETNNVMPQIVAASAYRMAVNELLTEIMKHESSRYIRGLINEFIEKQKEEV